MLDNPLIFGILCSTIITIVYTLIMIKTHNTDNTDNPYNKNNSIILFTISLIIISISHLFVSSNIKDLNPGGEISLENNISSNMIRGTPEF
jgi:hypothetical protein